MVGIHAKWLAARVALDNAIAAMEDLREAVQVATANTIPVSMVLVGLKKSGIELDRAGDELAQAERIKTGHA